MDVKGIRLLDRIGEAGLRRVLHDSLERAGLVQLANACRVRLPGRRAQSVADDLLIDGMLKAFLEDPPARATIMKTLARANRGLLARLRELTPSQRAIEAVRAPEAEAGRFLFALADDDAGAVRAALATLLVRLAEPAGAPPGEAADQAREPAADPDARRRALLEEIEALRGRLKALEEARARSEAAAAEAGRRETALREELVAAHKESHHLRKEVERADEERRRLASENQALARRAEERERPGGAGPMEELGVRLNQLIRETRKLGHDVEELQRARGGAGDAARPYLDALGSSIEALRREIEEMRRGGEDELRRASRAAQEAAAEARAARSEIAQWRRAAAAASPSPRRRGEPDRVGLFVDVQNMYYAARQLNARLDFGALMAAVTRDRRLIRAMAYVVQNPDIDQSAFLAMLQQKNYEIRRKDLKVRMDGSSKGDWDMEIALDILHLADSLDVVVLASGDGDFTSLVNQIKTRGPKVEVYSFPGSTARELVEASDRYVPLDEGFLIRLAPTLRPD